MLSREWRKNVLPLFHGRRRSTKHGLFSSSSAPGWRPKRRSWSLRWSSPRGRSLTMLGVAKRRICCAVRAPGRDGRYYRYWYWYCNTSRYWYWYWCFNTKNLGIGIGIDGSILFFEVLVLVLANQYQVWYWSWYCNTWKILDQYRVHGETKIAKNRVTNSSRILIFEQKFITFCYLVF